MARLRLVSEQNPRRKKFQHFMMKFRRYLTRTSVLLNFITILYFLYMDGSLTNIYRYLLF